MYWRGGDGGMPNRIDGDAGMHKRIGVGGDGELHIPMRGGESDGGGGARGVRASARVEVDGSGSGGGVGGGGGGGDGGIDGRIGSSSSGAWPLAGRRPRSRARGGDGGMHNRIGGRRPPSLLDFLSTDIDACVRICVPRKGPPFDLCKPVFGTQVHRRRGPRELQHRGGGGGGDGGMHIPIRGAACERRWG